MAGYIGAIPYKNIARDVRNYTSDGVTTSYDMDYVVGSIDVYHNGIHLDASQYVATNGTSITFANEQLMDGDKIMFVAWHAFRIVDLPFALRESTVDPTVNDDDLQGFNTQSRWINTITNSEFVCIDASTGSAIWRRTTDETTDPQRFYYANI